MSRVILYLFLALIILTSCNENNFHDKNPRCLEDFSKLNDKKYSISDQAVREHISRLIKDDGVLISADRQVIRYYAENKPFIWINRLGIHNRADTLLKIIQKANLYGFSTRMLKVSQIEKDLNIIRSLNVSDGNDNINIILARLEYNLTKALLRYSTGLRFGMINPDYLYNNLEKYEVDSTSTKFRQLSDLRIERPNNEFYSKVITQAMNDSFVDLFATILPQNDLYEKLIQHLNRNGLTYEEKVNSHNGEELRGYHKPIMLAGGIGNIRADHVQKGEINVGAKLIVLGGPAMNIGLGGGAASSMASGQSDADLDFASVQRDNPEMERRCQEVIDRCWQLGDANPILFIHDVGAGGLSNAMPELVSDGGRGGKFELRDILSDEPGMSPLEIWCNESQERYVLAVAADQLPLFDELCKRERAPYAVIGEATEELHLSLHDRHFDNQPIDLPLDVLLGKTPKMTRDVQTLKAKGDALAREGITIADAVKRVLHLPTVAEKTFLVTIGDRSVTGMVARAQLVGPWQVPVANCAVTTASLDSYYGEAMAIGERAPVALLDFAASARLAVGEALTNIAATQIGDIKRIKLSANWMAAAGHPGEDAGLYEAVKAVGEELCPALGLTIPVGKDSMSMKTRWQEGNEEREMTSPLSLVISAFARVEDVRHTITPQLSTEDNALLLIDLGKGNNALGATALAQVYRQLGDKPADVRDVAQLKGFYDAIQALVAQRKLLAYHDRSDGGLLVTLAEMAFAGHCGIDADIGSLGDDRLAALFNEELGAVIQVRAADREAVESVLAQHGLADCVHYVGQAVSGDRFVITANGQTVFSESRTTLRVWWAETTWQMQRLRDNPECADQEHQAKSNDADPGLNVKLSFDINEDVAAPFIATGARPKVAVLREQGVNSHVEMAAAFHRAGFDAIDVHMSDLLTGRTGLEDFHALVACGGFSYGDVLGAGEGWAKSILFNDRVRDEFATFFHRPQTLALGVCNGCQMMSNLRELIPGSELWPRFVRNTSDRFEARFSLVEVTQSPSLLLQGMVGSQMPIAVSHGEGRVEVRDAAHLAALESKGLVALRYVDNFGKVTETYPANPNGSPNGITSITTESGRVTIMMPHPERVFRTVSNSWHPENWGEDGPWMRIFRNARKQLG